MTSGPPFDAAPIFIGGEGRSGTTLLALVLDSHPRLAVGPELHFRGPADLGPTILDLLARRAAGDADDWERFRSNPDTYAGFHFVNRCHRCGIEPARLGALITSVRAATGSDLVTFEDRCQLVDAIGADMQARTTADAWGIKLMRDIRILERYRAAWPGARFVHLIRDGRDVAASQMRDHEGWGYDDARQAAERWADTIVRVRRMSETASVHELRYEDLVATPEPTIGRLLEFLGLPWDPAVLQHDQLDHALFRHPYRHPSEHSVRRPLNASAVGRWRTDLSVAERDAWMDAGGAMLLELGYEA